MPCYDALMHLFLLNWLADPHRSDLRPACFPGSNNRHSLKTGLAFFRKYRPRSSRYCPNIRNRHWAPHNITIPFWSTGYLTREDVQAIWRTLEGRSLLYGAFPLQSTNETMNSPTPRVQHALALPFFSFLISDVKRGLKVLSRDEVLNGGVTLFSQLPIPASILDRIPIDSITVKPIYVVLLMNLATQLVCVSGVNRLTSVRPTRLPDFHFQV